MTDLTPNHPAVLAALNAETQRQRTRVDAYADDHIREMVAALTAAEVHLTTATPENVARLRHTPAGRELMAEAWEDGAQAAWGESGEGWNGEYTGRSGPPSAFRAHNPNLPNPYKETQ